MVAVHHAARPRLGRGRRGKASHVWSAPPAVKKIDPTKKVTASAFTPARLMNPGKGPTRKQSDPIAKASAIQRSRLMHKDYSSWVPRRKDSIDRESCAPCHAS